MTSRGGPSRGGGRTGAGSVAERDPDRGEGDGGGDRGAVEDESDVDRPLAAPVLAELVGAVERIDDPDPVVGEPVRAVAPFLREDRIVRPGLGQLLDQEPVGGGVALVHHLPAGHRTRHELVPELDEQLARRGGQAHRELVVVFPGHADRGYG